jgi:hypothetical protein
MAKLVLVHTRCEESPCMVASTSLAVGGARRNAVPEPVEGTTVGLLEGGLLRQAVPELVEGQQPNYSDRVR